MYVISNQFVKSKWGHRTFILAWVIACSGRNISTNNGAGGARRRA